MFEDPVESHMTTKNLVIAGFYPFPHSLGVYHDVNAAIAVVAGSQVSLYAYEEEKLSRLKYDYLSRFADRSFLFGCKELGIDPEEVDVVVSATPYGINKDYLIKSIFHDQYKMRDDVRFLQLPHHFGHIGCAVYGNKFKSGLFVSADGGGDEADPRQLVWGTFHEGKIHEQGSSTGRGAFAYLHHLMTEAVGFTALENGKSMGLGSYGTLVPEIQSFIEKHLTRIDDFYHELAFTRYRKSHTRLHRLNRNGFNRFSVTRSPEGFTDLYDFCRCYPGPDIAYTVQSVLEDFLIEFLQKAIEKASFKVEALVFAGGFFQNILANRAVWSARSQLGIQHLYIPPGAGDSGNALGMVLYALHNELGFHDLEFPRDEDGYLTPFLGPSFSLSEMRAAVDDYAGFLDIDLKDDEESLLELVVAHLVEGRVLGWFQGRGEIGPRSLLARSVIADPRKARTKDRVNQLLKKREWFMPYAPSVLREAGDEFFRDFTPSPYMTMAFDVKEEKKGSIPAAFHIDGTARPNSVSARSDPLAHKLIKKFRDRTGIPLILNTSFNRHGIPTISSPEHAVDHLIRGNIDLLVMGPMVVSRRRGAQLPPEAPLVPTETFLIFEYLKPLIREAFFGDQASLERKLSGIMASMQSGFKRQHIPRAFDAVLIPEGFEIVAEGNTLYRFSRRKLHRHIDQHFSDLFECLTKSEVKTASAR